MYFSVTHLSVEGIAPDFHPKDPSSIPGSVFFLFSIFSACALATGARSGDRAPGRGTSAGGGAAKGGASECTGVDPLSQLAGASMVNYSWFGTG